MQRLYGVGGGSPSAILTASVLPAIRSCARRRCDQAVRHRAGGLEAQHAGDARAGRQRLEQAACLRGAEGSTWTRRSPDIRAGCRRRRALALGVVEQAHGHLDACPAPPLAGLGRRGQQDRAQGGVALRGVVAIAVRRARARRGLHDDRAIGLVVLAQRRERIADDEARDDRRDHDRAQPRQADRGQE